MTYIFIHLIHLSSIADSAEGGNVIYNRNFTGLSCRDRTFPISAGKARDVAIVLYCIVSPPSFPIAQDWNFFLHNIYLPLTYLEYPKKRFIYYYVNDLYFFSQSQILGPFRKTSKNIPRTYLHYPDCIVLYPHGWIYQCRFGMLQMLPCIRSLLVSTPRDLCKRSGIYV